MKLMGSLQIFTTYPYRSFFILVLIAYAGAFVYAVGSGASGYDICSAAVPCKPVRTYPVVSGRVEVYVSGAGGERFEHSSFNVTGSERRAAAAAAASSVRVQVSSSQRKQRIFGFGGAFTDTALYNIRALPSGSGDQVLADYFGSDGLRYTMGRVPIGGTDFSTRVYTYMDHVVDDFTLEWFQLQEEDLKWKIPALKKAAALAGGSLQLIASPWSAPAWMKSNGRIWGRGQLKGAPGDRYWKLWAAYLVRFLREYETRGVPMWALTTQNEPIDGRVPLFPFNCMGYSATQLRDWIKFDLGPALTAANYSKEKVKLYTIDDQRMFVAKWAEVIYSDPDAAKYLSGVAFHWYVDEFTAPTPLDQFHAAHPEAEIVMSEASSGATLYNIPWYKHVRLGDWQRGESLAKDVIVNMAHWTQAWIEWNLAVDQMGGPTWVSNYVDASVVVDAGNGRYFRQPSYYAMAHFSRLVPPNSTRIQSDVNCTHASICDRIHVIAFEQPGSDIVVSALNTLTSAQLVSISDGEHVTFTYEIPAKTLVTFVWQQSNSSGTHLQPQ